MASQLIDDLVTENLVVVFSKSYCPYCTKAKKALKSIGVDFVAIELDNRDDGSEIQNSLHKKTGQRTVPNVFVRGKSIGGGDDTARMCANGELQKLLDA